MTTITREQAVCMLYCAEYNEKNVNKYIKIIDELEDLDICYNEDPMEPILISVFKINAYPLRFKKYSSEEGSSNKEEEENNDELRIVSNAQLIDFLNSVFLPYNPFNNEMYDNKRISTKEILSFVWKYSSIHDSKSISTFGKWMKNNKLHLLECPIKRVYDNENSKIQTRNLYVLKDKFLSDNLNNIVNYMPKYKVQLQQFKNDGYTIIGYARKSKGQEAEETQKKLLQLMCNNLRNRSLTDYIFISYQCQANDLIYERDKIRNQNMLEELSVDGDTKDMIEFISIKTKVCIVALDYSGLSTNHLDLQEFIRNNASIKKIIIDTLPFNNKVKIYDRDQLLNHQDIMMQFDCRMKCLQRSK